jgi:UDP-3-O-[3-hydroxymyristoyl] glucosamine N-acyltransferase
MTEKMMSVDYLATMVNGQVEGDGGVLIQGFAPLDSAGPGEISFLVKQKDEGFLAASDGAAFIVPMGVKGHGDKPLIRVKDPYLAVAIIHSHLMEVPFNNSGVHPRAHVGDGCSLGKEISIGPMVVLGDCVTVGERVTIESGVVIGDDVAVGDDSTIRANVTIGHRCIIGNRVIIHSGTVVGSDGYGYSVNELGEHIKRPQVGLVQIDDDVEIGANCAIDRAAYGTTWIKSGTKIDNLVQVAHNVIIGENSLIVAQVGLAGSTTLGRNVVMGGQSATSGHIVLGDQVMVAARGGAHKDHPKGTVLGGAPAIPIRQWAKAIAVFAKLPELQKSVRKNSKAISLLESTVGEKFSKRKSN